MPEYPEDHDLEEIRQACLASGTFLVFAAVLSDRLDETNKPIIDVHYLRRGLPIENAKTGLEQFIRHYQADASKVLSMRAPVEGEQK